MTSGSCGDVIRDTAAIISKKFSPHIVFICVFFLINFSHWAREAAGALMDKIRRIWMVMMWCTVAFCMFPAGTSQQRWLKDGMMDAQELIPPLLFSLCLRPSRCFSFDPHKGPLFLFPGLSIPQRSQVTLVSGWSCHCKSKHLTATRAWWKRRSCEKAADTSWLL